MNFRTKLCILLLGWAVIGVASQYWQIQICGIFLAMGATGIAFFAKDKP